MERDCTTLALRNLRGTVTWPQRLLPKHSRIWYDTTQVCLSPNDMVRMLSDSFDGMSVWPLSLLPQQPSIPPTYTYWCLITQRWFKPELMSEMLLEQNVGKSLLISLFVNFILFIEPSLFKIIYEQLLYYFSHYITTFLTSSFSKLIFCPQSLKCQQAISPDIFIAHTMFA